jgi:hypothetical protein
LVEELGFGLADAFALVLEDTEGGKQRWLLDGETPRRFELECVIDSPLILLASCADPAPKPVERWTVRNLVELAEI